LVRLYLRHLLVSVELELLNDRATGVLEDDELVRDYAVNNLLFLVLRQRVNIASTVELRFTTRLALTPVENFIDVYGLVTALVLVGTASA